MYPSRRWISGYNPARRLMRPGVNRLEPEVEREQRRSVALEHVLAVVAAQVQEGVAIAVSVLQLFREVMAFAAEDLEPRIGEALAEADELVARGNAFHELVLESARHQARGGAVTRALAREHRPAPGRDVERDLVGIDAVHLLHQVGELRAHARIHL